MSVGFTESDWPGGLDGPPLPRPRPRAPPRVAREELLLPLMVSRLGIWGADMVVAGVLVQIVAGRSGVGNGLNM